MPQKHIKLYVDVVSPFGFQAYYILRNNEVFKSVQKTYIPVFLGGIMKSTGNRAPLEVKSKFAWINKERVLNAQKFNIPQRTEMFPNFPIMTLYIQRVLAALTIIEPSNELLAQCLDALHSAMWEDHIDISKPDNFTPILEKVLGKEKAAKAIAMGPKEGKDLVLKNSQAAVDEGAFGLPWFGVDKGDGKVMGFWGVASLPYVCDFLEIEGLDMTRRAVL